jgi:hypothetical protein
VIVLGSYGGIYLAATSALGAGEAAALLGRLRRKLRRRRP